MDIGFLLKKFEEKLQLQRYSENSISNYKSAVKSFLEVADKKFPDPKEIDETIIPDLYPLNLVRF